VKIVAKKAQEAGITKWLFDRNGYLYHGELRNWLMPHGKGGIKF
jgi:large subunit ribosomal protein L18